MKVLYLCHRIPYPPTKGDKIRAFHQLRALSSRHEVDVFTLADDAADLAYCEPLLLYCRQARVARLDPRFARIRALPFLLTNTPLTLPYFYSGELKAAIRDALRARSYDRIFVYCSAMAQYVEGVSGIPVVVDFVDVDSDKWRQYSTHAQFPLSGIYRRETRCLAAYERKICGVASAVVVSTGREAAVAREICGTANIHVVSNGVDADYFDPSQVPPTPGPPAIVFTGDMSYYPNEDAVVYFAREVLPLIRKAVPEAQFFVVGRNPTNKVRALQAEAGIQVTGFVPDIRTYLAKARVAVAPFSIAAGIQNKILEALAYGLPVVATSRTVQGLSADVAPALDTADAADEMASTILKLLRDPELASRKGAEGRRRVVAGYDWNACMNQLLRIVEDPAGVTSDQTRTASAVG